MSEYCEMGKQRRCPYLRKCFRRGREGSRVNTDILEELMKRPSEFRYWSGKLNKYTRVFLYKWKGKTMICQCFIDRGNSFVELEKDKIIKATRKQIKARLNPIISELRGI